MDLIELINRICSDIPKMANKRYTKDDIINELYLIGYENQGLPEKDLEDLLIVKRDRLVSNNGRPKVGPYKLAKNIDYQATEEDDRDNIVIGLLTKKLNKIVLNYLEIKP